MTADDGYARDLISLYLHLALDIFYDRSIILLIGWECPDHFGAKIMGKKYCTMTNVEKVAFLQGAALDVLVSADLGEIDQDVEFDRLDYLADLLYDIDHHANII